AATLPQTGPARPPGRRDRLAGPDPPPHADGPLHAGWPAAALGGPDPGGRGGLAVRSAVLHDACPESSPGAGREGRLRPVLGAGRQRPCGFRTRPIEAAWLCDPLSCITHAWNEVQEQVGMGDFAPYWELAAPLPVVSPAWRKQAARVARRLLERHRQARIGWLDNIWVLHLARLCLMLADHHYSSLGLDGGGQPVLERQTFVQADQT